MSRGPLGMVLVYPAGIVLMPPVGIVPMSIWAVSAIAAAVGDLAPDLGIFLHELLQSRMLVAPFPVVDQARISLPLGLHILVAVEPVIQALFAVLGRRD